MVEVEVPLGDRSYSILVEPGLLARAGDLLAAHARGGKLAIVSDDTVWPLLGPSLSDALAVHKIEAVPLIVPSGDAAKRWPVLIDLIDRLLALELGRSDSLVAFGGGAVGDLAGFAASLLKRGCRHVQIPTTLLAQVDSSVGGKTAINTAAGKNLVGTFHQPSLVLIDPRVLDSLPERQVRAGYAEVVKYGLIGDRAFFDWLEANRAAIFRGDDSARVEAIVTSVRAKVGIVGRDERETGGVRALLNLGHTFGHALEAEAGYSDRLLHGEAVAIGMTLAFAFSAERGLCPAEDAARVRRHLEAAELPLTFDADPAALVARMRQDKKASGSTVPFILARGIGQAFVANDVDLADVEAFLARQRERAG